MSDQSEQLARRVRTALGPHDEPELSVTQCVAAVVAELAEARRERDELRELLARAAEYTRHPDYGWDLGFARDVDAAIDAARKEAP